MRAENKGENCKSYPAIYRQPEVVERIEALGSSTYEICFPG